MPKRQLNVMLDEATIARLEVLAQRTGRSKTFYATEGIETHLDDLEDYFLAKDALEEFRQSDDATIKHTDVDWDAVIAQ